MHLKIIKKITLTLRDYQLIISFFLLGRWKREWLFRRVIHFSFIILILCKLVENQGFAFYFTSTKFIIIIAEPNKVFMVSSPLCL